MYQINEKITQAHQDSITSIHELCKKTIENTHHLAHGHLEASKELIAKTQQRMMELGRQKGSKDLVHVLAAQGFQEASTDLMTYQATVTASLRKNQQEVIEKIESAIADAKKHLQELVDGAISIAPPGSEVFTASFKIVFENTLQGYDHFLSKVQDTYVLAGRTVDNAMTAHNQEIQKSGKKIKVADIT